MFMYRTAISQLLSGRNRGWRGKCIFGDYTVWIETVKDFLYDYFYCGFVYVKLKINMTKDFPHAKDK
jgi:hypothetical protein